jgi:hypothetical protein
MSDGNALLPHTVGLDLGQSRDYSAVAVLEAAYWLTEEQAWTLNVKGHGWVWPGELVPAQIDQARGYTFHHGHPPGGPLALRHLHRWETGTPYPAIVRDVVQLVNTPPLRHNLAALAVDATGVGAPVVDLFLSERVIIAPITITAGFTVAWDPYRGSYTVPKRDLVSVVSVLLEQRRLLIPEALPTRDLLTRELQAFRRRVTPVGTDTYASWREQDHDDLVLAVALAAWHYVHHNSLIERQNARRHAAAAAS